jgi:hypothetical protein
MIRRRLWLAGAAAAVLALIGVSFAPAEGAVGQPAGPVLPAVHPLRDPYAGEPHPAESTTTTAYDTLKVQVLNSSGTVLSTLHTYSNLDHNTGYAQHSFSLSAYAGQTITLKFTGSEDYEYQTSFVIDDTAVNVS